MANNVINILIEAKDHASKVLQQLGGNMGNVEGNSNRLRDSLAGMAAVSLRAGAAVGAAGAAALTAGGVIGFKFNSAVEQAEAQLMAFTKSSSQTADILQYVKDEAAKTQFSFTDMAQATAGLIPISRQTGVALQDLIREAEILAALNPSEGLTGAAFSLKEALSGDFVSIVDRFNLPRKRLNELKEQGVPAMQAIQTALREMGIDYDLVAKQGETTAARWDQVKDKFTQMAGEYSKPLFDAVSRALDALPDKVDRGKAALDRLIGGAMLLQSGDFNARIGQLLGVEEDDQLVTKLLNISETLEKVADTVNQVLGPSMAALGQTLKSDYIPTLQKLAPYLDDFAKVAGGILVVALWLAINTLRIMIEYYRFFVDTLLWSKNVAVDVATTTADRFVAMKDRVVGVFTGIRDAASTTYGYVRTLDWGGLFSYVGKGVGNSIIGIIEGALKGALGGLPGGIANKIKLPRFAQGGVVSSPTVGVFGEAGPEAIIPLNKPARAAQVMQEAGLASGQTVINYNGPFYFQTAEAVREIFALQDGNSVLAAQGLSVVRP